MQLKSEKREIDGLIFNQVFGCPSISNVYSAIQNEIKEQLELPTIVIDFKKIGQNIDIIKPKLENFMEQF